MSDDEYTPTTDEVRACWAAWVNYGGVANAPHFLFHDEAVEAFGRWLKSEKAEAWEEGLNATFGMGPDTNPYRERS